jgi:hypothetical protein
MKRHVVERKTFDVAPLRGTGVEPERWAGLLVDRSAALRSYREGRTMTGGVVLKLGQD